MTDCLLSLTQNHDAAAAVSSTKIRLSTRTVTAINHGGIRTLAKASASFRCTGSNIWAAFSHRDYEVEANSPLQQFVECSFPPLCSHRKKKVTTCDEPEERCIARVFNVQSRHTWRFIEMCPDLRIDTCHTRVEICSFSLQ